MLRDSIATILGDSPKHMCGGAIFKVGSESTVELSGPPAFTDKIQVGHQGLDESLPFICAVSCGTSGSSCVHLLNVAYIFS